MTWAWWLPPRNSAISPPSLATILAFGGAVHSLRSHRLCPLILSLGSSTETLGRLPSQSSQPPSVPIPGDHTGTTGSPPHHPRDLGHYLRSSQIQVGSEKYVLSALRSSNMPREGASISYPSLGFQTLEGEDQDACLQFNPLLSSPSTSRLLPLAPKELLCPLQYAVHIPSSLLLHGLL